MISKLVLALFATTIICISLAENDYAFLINEINTGSPDRFKKKDFIELKMICDSDKPKSASLQGYKLIDIPAGTGKRSNIQQMTIDLVINLWNSKINERNMFTVGSDNVPNTDMNTKSASFNYRNKFSGNLQTIDTFLNTGNKHVHAIALLYKECNSFPEIVINAKNPFIVIDDNIEEIIKSSLFDFIVYARKAPYDHCNLFQ